MGHDALEKAGRIVFKWHHDPAASGPRERAWVGTLGSKTSGELIVYATGYWEVHVAGWVAAHGDEITSARAKRRALLVYRALVRVI